MIVWDVNLDCPSMKAFPSYPVVLLAMNGGGEGNYRREGACNITYVFEKCIFWVRFCIQTLVLIQTIVLLPDPIDRATLHDLVRPRNP